MSGDIFDILSEEARSKLRKREQPKWTEPMLATLVHDAFSDPDWIFERKLDGERALAFRDGKSVRLLSRNRKDLRTNYPDVAEALEQEDCDDFIVDGEIVAFSGEVTDFQRLQPRMQAQSEEEAKDSSVVVYYYIFDLLYLDGHDVTKVPLRDRKRLLKRRLGFEDRVRMTPHRNEDGEEIYKEACEKGWEGVIAKDASAEYVHSRSKKWLKFKCVNRQEFVIGGFTEPEGERIGFGALLICHHEKQGDRELVYAGKVGTGYDDQTLERLRGRLHARERKTPPFRDASEIHESDAHWVKPELVAQVGFTEWTEDGKLRHPRFLGLRRDKDASDVVRERA